MSLVTLTSDFGLKDTSLSVFKIKIATRLPDCKYLELSQDFNYKDLLQSVIYVKNVMDHSPPRSVHFLLINTEYKANKKFIFGLYKECYIVVPDNGLLALIDEESKGYLICENQFNYIDIFDNFVNFIENVNKNELGQYVQTAVFSDILRQKPLLKEDLIKVVAIFIDSYGNVWFNLKKEDFEMVRKGRACRVFMQRELTKKIHLNIGEVSPGEFAIYFNSLSYLEVGYKYGGAHKLLGLRLGSEITIVF